MKLVLSTLLLGTFAATNAVAQTAADAPSAPAAKPSREVGSYITFTAGTAGASDYSYSLSGFNFKTELDSGSQFGAAYGFQSSGPFRYEIALNYATRDVSSSTSGSLSVLSLDLNGYYDFPVKMGPVQPYIGAGIGAASVSVSDGILDGTGSGYTLQGIAGVSFKVADKAALFAEARIQSAGGIGVTSSGSSNESEDSFDVTSSGFLVGLRIGF